MVSLSLDSQLQWTYYRGSSKTLAKGRVVFMGIFSSKLKVDIESFCSNYYDSQMFHAIVNGEDGSQKLLDAAFQLLTDSDPYFLKVDRALFDCEMTAMHLELFALVFFQRFFFYHRLFFSYFFYIKLHVITSRIFVVYVNFYFFTSKFF